MLEDIPSILKGKECKYCPPMLEIKFRASYMVHMYPNTDLNPVCLFIKIQGIISKNVILHECFSRTLQYTVLRSSDFTMLYNT